MAAVAIDLKFRNIKNMRVADAPIVPSFPSGNKNAPTIFCGLIILQYK